MKVDYLDMALPSPSFQPAYPQQQAPVIPSSVFSSDKDLHDMVSKRDMRISSTHDLAEFLRSSRPEDYSRPPKALDDIEVGVGHKKISLKYLKSTSKELLSPRKNAVPVPVPSTKALPENVRERKTSKGNSYLAIQVDYVPAQSSDSKASPVTPSSGYNSNLESSIRNTASVDLSSEMSLSRNSTTSRSWKERDRYSHGDRDSYTYAREDNRWIRNSLGSELSAPRGTYIVSPISGGSGMSDVSGAIVTDKPKRVGASVFPPKYMPVDGSRSVSAATLAALTKVSQKPGMGQRRYSSDTIHRATAMIPPYKAASRSSELTRQKGEQQNTTGSPTAVPEVQNHEREELLERPGPPPTRCLPALPEGHGDAINLASKIRAAAAARSSIGSQLSVSSEAAFNRGRTTRAPSRSRPDREVSVKARKLKDLEESRNRRNTARLDANTTTDPAAQKTKKSQARSRKVTDPTINITFSPITVVYEVAPLDEPEPVLDTKPPAASKPEQITEILVEQAGSLRPNTSQSNNHSDLESRVKNLESKNHFLEQALLAVLRTAICRDNVDDKEGSSLADVVKCVAGATTTTDAT